MVEYQYPIRLLMSRKRCSPRSGTANSQKGGEFGTPPEEMFGVLTGAALSEYNQ